MDDLIINIFLLLDHKKTNRFNATVGLFTDRSQEMSKFGIIGTSVIHSAARREPLFCFYMLTFPEQTHGNMESIC